MKYLFKINEYIGSRVYKNLVEGNLQPIIEGREELILDYIKESNKNLSTETFVIEINSPVYRIVDTGVNLGDLHKYLKMVVDKRKVVFTHQHKQTPIIGHRNYVFFK